MAILLATLARLIGSGFALLWTRWLLQSMGPTLYGLFISFQALVSIGTMGDLGLGGTVGIQANRFLGAGKIDDLRNFLALARTAFLVLAFTLAGAFLAFSPWLAGLLGVGRGAHGSIILLFLVGSVTIAGTILANFTTGLSNACQNLTWPIIPNLLITQIAMVLHVWAARFGVPLWMQLAPYAGATLAAMALPWIFTNISHPALAELHPVSISWSAARRLFSQSFWVYLWSLGFLVYTTTDRLVINRFLGPELTSRYYLNYKPAELAVFLLVTLTFFTLTKIIQWHCSPEAMDQKRATAAALRLQRVQIFLGLVAGLFYLGVNDIFVRVWLGPNNGVALILQAVFAANLSVTVSGDSSTKIAGQITARGTVFAGAMVGVTAIINLVLSVIAARAGWLVGVAAATLLAQAFFGVTTGYFTARQLRLSPLDWIFRSTALPLLIIGIGYALRSYFVPDTLLSAFLLSLCYLGILIAAAFCLRITRKFISEEWRIVQSMGGF